MIRKLVLYLLCAEVVGASIFFGAVHTWAWSALVALSTLIFSLFWWDKITHGLDFPLPVVMSVALFAFAVSLSLQLFIPLEAKIPVASELEPALVFLQTPRTVSSPLNHYQARLTFYQWLIPIVALIVTPYSLRSRRDIRTLLGAIVLAGSLQGLYGIVQFLSQCDPFPFFARLDKQFPIGGTYICRNTYACFMAISAAVALGVLLELSWREHKRGESLSLTTQIRSLSDHPRFPLLATITLGILAMTLGCFLSLSRGGVICLAFAVVIFVSWQRRPHSHHHGGYLIWGLWLLLPLGVYLYITGIEPLLKRFADLPDAQVGRWRLAVSAFDIFCHHWLLGCGGGCYPQALEIYKPADFIPFRYAHNDYLQFLAEYGAISFICGLALFATWLHCILKKSDPPPHPTLLALQSGCLAGLSALLVHGFFDFSLHIPGHRLVGAILMSTLLCLKGKGQIEKFT